MDGTGGPWFRIRALDARSWAFDDHGADVMYLLAGRDRALLIDTGWGIGDLPTAIPIMWAAPGSSRAWGLRMPTEGWPLWSLIRARAVGPRRLAGALPRRVRSGCMAGTHSYVLPIADGEVLDLGERRLEVIALPGHSAGGVCLLDRGARWLFTGDSLFRWPVWMHLEESLPLGVFLGHLRRHPGRGCGQAYGYGRAYLCRGWPALRLWHLRCALPPRPTLMSDTRISGTGAARAGALGVAS